MQKLLSGLFDVDNERYEPCHVGDVHGESKVIRKEPGKIFLGPVSNRLHDIILEQDDIDVYSQIQKDHDARIVLWVHTTIKGRTIDGKGLKLYVGDNGGVNVNLQCKKMKDIKILLDDDKYSDPLPIFQNGSLKIYNSGKIVIEDRYKLPKFDNKCYFECDRFCFEHRFLYQDKEFNDKVIKPLINSRKSQDHNDCDINIWGNDSTRDITEKYLEDVLSLFNITKEQFDKQFHIRGLVFGQVYDTYFLLRLKGKLRCGGENWDSGEFL